MAYSAAPSAKSLAYSWIKRLTLVFALDDEIAILSAPMLATSKIKIIAKISENPFFMSPPYLTILLWQASALPSFSTKQSLKTIVLAMFGSLPSALKRKVLTPVASRLFLHVPLISQVSRYRFLSLSK